MMKQREGEVRRQPNPLTPFPVKEGGTENNFEPFPRGKGDNRAFRGIYYDNNYSIP